jgi:hypothetical protein
MNNNRRRVDINVPEGQNDDLLDTAIIRVKQISEYTAPDLSIGFIAFLITVTALHETDARIAVGLIVPWILIQLFTYTTTQYFRNDLFWGILGLVGNVAFYLFVGHMWSYAKLYIEISQERIVLDCNSSDCILEFLDKYKWLIANWTIQWPASILFTLANDPFRAITNTLFKWSRQRYIWIISSALSNQSSEISIHWWIIGILGYFLCGFIWTHIKLFIDVWQSNLSPDLEKLIKKGSYRDFILEIKWIVLQWMFTWPFSVAYNVIRHPMRLLAEFIYQLSERKYIWVTQKAVDMRNK